MSDRKHKSREQNLPESMKPVEFWPDPVDGGALLSAISDTVGTYMILPKYAAETVALWCIFAHCHEAAEHSPILAIQSPEKRCGKTTMLNIIGRLVPVPLPAANVTTPVIFRAIETFHPTLLLDEVETFILKDNEMRGVLNSGFTRESAVALRCVGDEHEPRPFSTWCPKVGALIGNLPDTLQDRSIVITLRRRLVSERSERFGRSAYEPTLMLHRQAARWAADHLDVLAIANDPPMPNKLDDRAEDAWRPLLAIADVVGGKWPDKARKAAEAISGATAADAVSQSKGVLLLAHIRELFRSLDATSLQSSYLVHKLNENEEWPWGEWRGGKPISARGVAMKLKRYGVRPNQKSAGSFYSAADFEDAWARYLPALTGSSATRATEVENANDVCELMRPDLHTASTLQVPASATDGTTWHMPKVAQPADSESEMTVVADGIDDEGGAPLTSMSETAITTTPDSGSRTIG